VVARDRVESAGAMEDDGVGVSERVKVLSFYYRIFNTNNNLMMYVGFGVRPRCLVLRV
jgi:hypothetical protein